MRRELHHVGDPLSRAATATAPSSEILVTVMIATRNRSDELRKTLRSLREQIGCNLEIVVVDDASSDPTSDMVKREFPDVRLIQLLQNVGSVQARNLIIENSSGTYIVGLDDDSRFIEPDAISRIVDRMEAEPDLGIINFQAIGPEHPERMTEEGRLTGEWHTCSYAACGVVIRRSMLAKTGTFPAFFFHMYEEPDLCIRAWDCGYRVLQWNEVVVYHEWSGVNRSEQKVHHCHVRNEACSILMRYPFHLILPAILYRLQSQLIYAMRRGWKWSIREPIIWADIIAHVPSAIRYRRPVSQRAVKISLSLNRQLIASREAVWRLGSRSWAAVLFDKPHRSGEARV